jgi:hypothetical protein
MDTNYLIPFADWLSISYPTSLSPHLDLVAFFNTLSPLIYTDMGGSKQLYKSINGGSIFITSRDNYVNVSISGTILDSARQSGQYTELQTILSSSPYNITRLDCAYDVPLAGSLSIDRIETLYPSGIAVVAGRPRQMQYITTKLNSTTRTGTVYFQNTKYKGTVKLRVYDKANEVYEKQNQFIRPTTRYELSIARGASLKDFHNPASAFWHFLPVELLKRPQDLSIKPWVATERINYDEYSKMEITDYARFKFLIENHPALLELINAAKLIHGADVLFTRHIIDSLNTDALRHVESKANVNQLLS